MSGPVVVGVDGSVTGERALDWATDEARRRKRTLRVLHAYGWPLPDLPVSPDRYRAPRPGMSDGELARDVAERHAARARRAAPELTVETVVSGDLPGPALVTASLDASVVVVGSRGLGSVTELLLGSVSSHVVAHARVPVVVVRRPADPHAPVLVGVDGKPASDRAVGWAFEQAASRRVPLIAVHAWQAPVSRRHGDMLPLVHDPAMLAKEEARVLTEALTGGREEYPDVVVRACLRHERPAKALLAESTRAGLLVVGAHGRSEWRGLLLGSVSRHVLHHAGVPVAVVHERR
ncbi:universal stress protein [Virgisporangium aliadipatigenens]|uniref:Universal stress protein n=1 Tax=Virgisporangium aliadipatigenens TaxID=741659 RepID=A0A8J3YM85_9ACTN|nr:universal stress protein [Virgisporangium aliadipatigenens]GIJ48079.1 universal stress protein [Virgisporangium aliadipatigenens]